MYTILKFVLIARSQVSVKSDNGKFKMHLKIQLNPLEEKMQVKYKIQITAAMERPWEKKSTALVEGWESTGWLRLYRYEKTFG